jgi:predicted O-methyltransferase YrrM
MNKLLEKVFESQKFLTKDNLTINIHSNTGKEQCQFLQRIILENKFSKSIEIGFAYGISALAIIEEIEKQNGKHVVIDKFQNSDWNGVGLDLINQAGYSEYIYFNEEYSYVTLPKLLEEGRSFNFAYIDSTKLLDFLLVDFFFLDKLLEKGGIIVFDDVAFLGIRKLLRYIAQFPNYIVHDTFPKNIIGMYNNRFLTLIKKIPIFKKILRKDLLTTDYDLGIYSHCVALKKN